MTDELAIALNRHIAKTDKEQRIKDAMESLIKEINMGDSTEVGEMMGKSLTFQHPTLQQCFMGALLKTIEVHGMKDYTDARNDASVKWARELTKSPLGMGGFPFI